MRCSTRRPNWSLVIFTPLNLWTSSQ